MQVVVDFLSNTHDSLYECIMDDDDGDMRKDEFAVRKFLLLAQEKGFSVKGLYDLDDKIKRLNKGD